MKFPYWRPRRIWLIPSHRRVAVNLSLARDLFYLGRDERQALAATFGMGQVQLPAAALGRALNSRAFPCNVTNFVPTAEHEASFADDPTVRFVRELIGEGRHYRDTSLYRDAMAGQRIVRRLDGERRRLRSDADFAAYRGRCLALADSIAKHGVVDLESPAAGHWGDAGDGNILVAIDEAGNFVHYRCGRHRLAIAQALDAGPIPASVFFISGHCLRSHLPPWRITLGALRAAVARSIDSAMMKAGRAVLGLQDT